MIQPELPHPDLQPTAAAGVGTPLPYAPLTWHGVFAAILSGMMMALSFPGADVGIFAWIGLVPFCLVVFKPRRKRAMMGVFGSFGAGFYLVLLYWFLAMHPLTWLGFSEWGSLGIVTFAWLGATFLLVLQLLFFGAVYGWLTRRWPTPAGVHVLALALGWTALEWVTSLGTFGFTWGNLALSQAGHLTMIQVLDLVGPFPLAGVLVAFNGAIALGILRRTDPVLQKFDGRPVGAVFALVLAIQAYGLYRLGQPAALTTFSVEIVQGNLAGGDKWTKEHDAVFKMADKYLTLSKEHPLTDLLLWPETALPDFLRNNPRLMQKMQNEARTQKRALMFGTLDWSGQRPDLRLYNAIAAIDPRGTVLGFDYKRHLVPYGEYVPWRAWMPAFLLQINIVGSDFFPGIQPTIFEFPFAKIGAGICYDGIFPDAVRPAVLAGAEVLALITNDAWYKDTTAPRVLNAHAALRAVENRRWVLRAANTGICSVIEPTGNIVAQTPVFQDATLLGRAAPLRDLTLYTRFGDWASLLAFLVFLGLLGGEWKNRSRKSA